MSLSKCKNCGAHTTGDPCGNCGYAKGPKSDLILRAASSEKTLCVAKAELTFLRHGGVG